MSSILLVEDDRDLRDLIADLLATEGHHVEVAADGLAALKRLDERIPQLVISDLEMPAIDGLTLIHRMFVQDLGRENVPVILMSASSRLRQAAQATGTRYILPKPFSVDALGAIVARALREAIPPSPPLPPIPLPA